MPYYVILHAKNRVKSRLISTLIMYFFSAFLPKFGKITGSGILILPAWQIRLFRLIFTQLLKSNPFVNFSVQLLINF